MKYKPSTYHIILILLLARTIPAMAQDLDQIGEEEPLKINGGISANQILYLSNDSIERRDPYSYVVSGNLTFNLYGWTVPFSYTFSNQNSSFQQPFNQYGLHPTYKWLTAHVGYSSMTFSPYTLNGHLFYGAGVEADPEGLFSFSAMYGRLQRAVDADTLAEKTVEPAFKRIGYGLKAGIDKGGNQLEVILFKAADQFNSLNYIPRNSGLTPKENLVLSVIGRIHVIENLNISAELSGSALTDDTRNEFREGPSNIYASSGLYKPRISSSYNKAFTSALNYSFESSAFGLNYERIAPGYRTLGAYYFNNDYENITVNAATQLFDNKLSLSLNTGLQQDNLDNKKASKTKRVVSSVNVGYNASEKLNLNGSYSNFQTHTNIRSQFQQINQLTPYDNLDTLDFTQLSQTANLNTAYTLKSDDQVRQHLNMNLSLQVASDNQASEHSGSTFFNSNMSYSHTFIPRNMSLMGAFNTSYNETGDLRNLTLGPSVSINRSFFDKTLRTTLTVSQNNTLVNGEIVNGILTSRLSNTYRYRKKHNFNLNLVFAKRSAKSEQSFELAEFTGTLGYTYSF